MDILTPPSLSLILTPPVFAGGAVAVGAAGAGAVSAGGAAAGVGAGVGRGALTGVDTTGGGEEAVLAEAEAAAGSAGSFSRRVNLNGPVPWNTP